jgi:hypothetical protein
MLVHINQTHARPDIVLWLGSNRPEKDDWKAEVL